MKAQVSVEYVMIASIALIALIPLILYSNQMIVNYNESNKITLAKNAVKKLGESADWVYSQGQPARFQTDIYFPEGIESSSLQNNTVLLRIRTPSGLSDVYYTTVSRLNGSLPEYPGHYTMSLVAFYDYVDIRW